MKIYKLNVNDYDKIAGNYSLIGVPAVLYFNDGKIVFKHLGVLSVSQLESLQKEHF